eukprot:SAG31_NODE_3906_length_3765_cov_1.595745_2_plen_116_part_00
MQARGAARAKLMPARGAVPSHGGPVCAREQQQQQRRRHHRWPRLDFARTDGRGRTAYATLNLATYYGSRVAGTKFTIKFNKFTTRPGTVLLYRINYYCPCCQANDLLPYHAMGHG